MYYTIYKCIVFELTLFIVPFFLHAPPRFDLFYEWPAVARRCDHRPHRGRGVMLESRSVACRVAVLCSIVGSRMMFLRKLSFTLLQKLQASVCLTYMYVHRISSINITVHTFIVWKNCLRYGDRPPVMFLAGRQKKSPVWWRRTGVIWIFDLCWSTSHRWRSGPIHVIIWGYYENTAKYARGH